jgi:hypothetical protein
VKAARIIAIDPGASGGIAEFSSCGQHVTAFKMPELSDLRDYLEAVATASSMEGVPLLAVLEQVGGYIGGNATPGSAMFNFGRGVGHIEGLLAAYHVRTELVRPQVWQKGLPGIAGEKDKATRKRALKENAARLFPNLKVTLSTADALLIGDYARRVLLT